MVTTKTAFSSCTGHDGSDSLHDFMRASSRSPSSKGRIVRRASCVGEDEKSFLGPSNQDHRRKHDTSFTFHQQLAQSVYKINLSNQSYPVQTRSLQPDFALRSLFVLSNHLPPTTTSMLWLFASRLISIGQFLVMRLRDSEQIDVSLARRMMHSVQNIPRNGAIGNPSVRGYLASVLERREKVLPTVSSHRNL
jgi:hypothetical protein